MMLQEADMCARECLRAGVSARLPPGLPSKSTATTCMRESYQLTRNHSSASGDPHAILATTHSRTQMLVSTHHIGQDYATDEDDCNEKKSDEAVIGVAVEAVFVGCIVRAVQDVHLVTGDFAPPVA